MTAEEAVQSIQDCLKAQGLLKCLHGEINDIRRALSMPLIDRYGYEEEEEQ